MKKFIIITRYCTYKIKAKISMNIELLHISKSKQKLVWT